jgi:hypothetical protein
MRSSSSGGSCIAAWCLIGAASAPRHSSTSGGRTLAEARRPVKDVYAFERTGTMGPDHAAEFIVREMTRPDRGPFERRNRPR